MTADEYREIGTALARNTKMSTAAASRIEQALVSAMMSRAAGDTARWPNGKSVRPSPEWRLVPAPVAWAAVAASFALIVGSAVIWQINASLGRRDAVVPPSPPVIPVLAAIGPPHPSQVIDLSAASPPHRTAPRPPRQEEVVTPSGFVALPGTAELPAFESGEIIRMEMPVGSLAAYGIDISSGGDRPVEADILVGQDGFARAIRLVTHIVRSTQ
jgi:hypothetical protein